MDNKGQSLVLFVLIMPILFILFLTIGDVGNLMVSQDKYDSEIKSAIRYGLKHRDEENVNLKIKSLLDYSISEDKEIVISNGGIEVKVLKKNKVMGFDFDSTFDYIGHIQDGKIIIDRL